MHDRDHDLAREAQTPATASTASAPPASATPRARREQRLFDDLVNALGDALLRAHGVFLESLEPPPEGITLRHSWIPELRSAASSAMADAAELGDERLLVAAGEAFVECARGFKGQVEARTEDREARHRLRAIVTERFVGVAEEALLEACHNAQAALEAEALDEGAGARATEEIWSDRDDVLAVACVDDDGVVWGTWVDASPPLHVENIGRPDGAPRVRIDLEKQGVRAFAVVEGTLTDDARTALAQRLTFREELEDAWVGALVARGQFDARRETSRVVLVPCAGTPHAYEVAWSYEELFPEQSATQNLARAPLGRLTADPPALRLALGPDGSAEPREFRLAGLVFSDLPPAWVIGWRGRDARVRNLERDEECLRGRNRARAAFGAHLVETLFANWEHAHTGETVASSAETTERTARLAVLDLDDNDRSPSLVSALCAWASVGLDEASVARVARRRLRAVAPTLDDPKPVGPLPMTDDEREALCHADLAVFLEGPSRIDVDAARFSEFWLDAIAPEWAGLGHAKLLASVGEFVPDDPEPWNAAPYDHDDADAPWAPPPDPRVIVSLPRSWRDPILREAQITLDEDPVLRGRLPEPLASRALALVEKHRDALLDHWHGRTDTAELAEALRVTLDHTPSRTA